jgi:methylaspartate mutase sigma subunit
LTNEVAEERLGRVVLGVVGADVHVVGARVLDYALTEAGYDVVNIGIMCSQEEFIDTAIETNADAILVSSVYGHGEIDCRGFRDKCVESGIGSILLLVGGNLVVGKADWAETEPIFLGYGFDRAYPPGTSPEVAIKELDELMAGRRSAEGRA